MLHILNWKAMYRYNPMSKNIGNYLSYLNTLKEDYATLL